MREVYCAATGSSAHGTTNTMMARRSVFSILQRAVTLLCWAVPTLPLLQCLLGSLPLHWVGYLPLPHAGPNTVYVPGALRCFALLCCALLHLHCCLDESSSFLTFSVHTRTHTQVEALVVSTTTWDFCTACWTTSRKTTTPIQYQHFIATVPDA